LRHCNFNRIYVISHMERRLLNGSNYSGGGTSHHSPHTGIPLWCLPCPVHKYRNMLNDLTVRRFQHFNIHLLITYSSSQQKEYQYKNMNSFHGSIMQNKIIKTEKETKFHDNSTKESIFSYSK